MGLRLHHYKTLSFHSIPSSSTSPFNGPSSSSSTKLHHNHSLLTMSSSSSSSSSSTSLNQRRLTNNNPTTFLHTSNRQNPNPNFKLHASSSIDPPVPSSSNRKTIIITSALTITLAVANRVLYKLALVPMKQYPFFLAQLTTFGYVMIYFSILFIRYRANIVSNEMLQIPKLRFMAIGILEALGVASGMASAAMLPGPAIPLLNQTFLVWQLAFSVLILGRRFSLNQILGCLLVGVGVAVAVVSGPSASQIVTRTEFIWPAIMIASCAFQAGASIIKEYVFLDAAKRLKGKSLDIFVVNSFGSGFQALFVLIFLPFLSNLKGIPFAQLPSYLKSGAGCFLNIGGSVEGCAGAPWLPLLYIATNMTFNISVLSLLKYSSAVVSSLAVMLSVPISIYVLSLPLPYLPEGASLSPFFLFGGLILVLGLALYNIPQPANESSKVA
ncbi:hypothetical protein ACFE04_012743 [Oxalis oulophora]